MKYDVGDYKKKKEYVKKGAFAWRNKREVMMLIMVRRGDDVDRR